jgi:Sigma-70, region 4
VPRRATMARAIVFGKHSFPSPWPSAANRLSWQTSMRISQRVKPALAIPEAISRFDLRRQKRFSTYLAHRLRGAITAATRELRRSSIFDKTQYFPDKQETPAEWSDVQPRSAGDFWSPQVIRWARRRRRRNDRMIVKWLWLDRQPKTQAEVARRLGISRSAVCQRRRILMTSILQIAPDTLFDQELRRESLNIEEDDFYLYV